MATRVRDVAVEHQDEVTGVSSVADILLTPVGARRGVDTASVDTS